MIGGRRNEGAVLFEADAYLTQVIAYVSKATSSKMNSVLDLVSRYSQKGLLIDINRYNVSLRTTRAKHLLRLRALAMVYTAKSMQQSSGN